MTKQELQQLRNEITLNSLFTDDYTNSFNIDPRQVQDFFDGWVDYCRLENEEYLSEFGNDQYYVELFNIANNIDNLVDYYIYMFEEDPLSQEFFEKYYK
jgi:hypothetical protein